MKTMFKMMVKIDTTTMNQAKNLKPALVCLAKSPESFKELLKALEQAYFSAKGIF